MIRSLCLLTCLIAGLSPAFADSPVDGGDKLEEHLAHFLTCLSGKRDAFTLTADIDFVDGDKTHKVKLRFAKIDAQSFDLDVQHQEYWLKLYRRQDRIAMILPRHQSGFVGKGPVETPDHLRPQGITSRIISPGSMASVYLPIISLGEPALVTSALTTGLGLKRDSESGSYLLGDGNSIKFAEGKTQADLVLDESRVSVRLSDEVLPVDIDAELAHVKVSQIGRDELERSWTRGVRRALEVLAPSPLLTMPQQQEQEVPNGKLTWILGQRVVLLSGTPEQVGRAHGALLQQETLRCIDSVIHMFGLARTIESGRWFRQDLDAAYKRLESHIPDDHKQETDALADAIGWDRQLVQAVNVFPELFHCSGFALFGSATADGKLYHGRVLDYMTTIGLQDSATTFLVAIDGKIPFANVGYAGFIGSVSGMNDRAVSLGEMGGRGEGQWDGVPMATLMRRALEECSTLDEVKSLWKRSPRTCEYYYVFADGKTNEAVGVAATPDSLEFIEPGAAHPLLGDGIADAVVLSAGDRLQTLRSRVQQHHGKIDRETALSLMSRPVAMQSNLHNVLFIPQDGVMFVANADHKRPAAERPYAKIDVRMLLKSMKQELPAVAVSSGK